MLKFTTTNSTATRTKKKRRVETSPTPANNASQMAPTSFYSVLPSFSTTPNFDLTIRSYSHPHHHNRDRSSSRHRRHKAVTNHRARIWNSISMVPDVRETALNIANSLLNNFDYSQASFLKEILDFHIALSLPDTTPQTDMVTMIDSNSLERILTLILDVNIASIGQVQGSLSRELQLELVVSCLLLFQLMGVTHFQPATFNTWCSKLDALSKALNSDREKQINAQSFDSWFFDQFAHELLRSMPSAEGNLSRTAKVVLNTLYAAGYVYQFNGKELQNAVDEIFSAFKLSQSTSTVALAKIAKLTLGCIALLYQSEVQGSADYEKAATDLAVKIAGGIADQMENTAKSQLGKTALANISTSTLGKTVATKEYYKYGLLFFLNRLAQAFPGNKRVVALAKSCAKDAMFDGNPAVKLRLKALEVSVRTKSEDDTTGNEERFQRLISDVSQSNKVKDGGESLKKNYEQLKQFLEQRDQQVGHALTYVERQLGSQEKLRLMSGPVTAPAIMDSTARSDYSPKRVQTLIEEDPRPLPTRSNTTGAEPFSDKYSLRPDNIPITVTEDPESFVHHSDEPPPSLLTPRVDTVSTEYTEPLNRQSTWSSSGVGVPSFGMNQAPRHDRRESRASNSTSDSSNARRQTRDWSCWSEDPDWGHLDIHDFTFMSDEIKPLKSGRWRKKSKPWKMPVVSENCDFICYASTSSIRIGAINGLGPGRSIAYHDWELPSPQAEFIRDVSVANDGTLVVITEHTTYVHHFPPSENTVAVIPSNTLESSSSIWGQSCVVISPSSDKIVIGLQQAAARLKPGESGRFRGKLRILQRSPNGTFRSPFRQDLPIPHYETRDKKNGLDIPKILSFSRDGAYLACSTQESSRIYVWKLETLPNLGIEYPPSTPTGSPLRIILVGHGKVEFQQNNHILGITSLTILSRRASNPYLLITVHRSLGPSEDAALTLVPITTSFSKRPPIRHTQPQHYASLASTATLSGSTVAVLNGSGTISIFSTAPTDPVGLHLREVGTLTATSGRILTGKDAEHSIYDNGKLGKSGCLSQGLDSHEQAKLCFSPDGTRLVAADKNGRVLVWRFYSPDPETLRQTPVDRANPSPIPSGRYSVQSEAVHELAEGVSYLSASPKMLGASFSPLGSSLPRSSGGESSRSREYAWGAGMPFDANGFGSSFEGRSIGSGVSQSEGGGVGRKSVGSPVSPLGASMGSGGGCGSSSVNGERVGRTRAGTHH